MLRKTWGLIRKRIALRANVTVGKGFQFGDFSTFWAPNELKIGSHVSVGSHCKVEVDGMIGNYVLIASYVGIIGRRDHAIDEVGTPITQATWIGSTESQIKSRVDIGDDVWIGFGATIVSGVQIGASSVIGAGSVVVSDIPANSIAVGNPARVIGPRFSAEDYERHREALELLLRVSR